MYYTLVQCEQCLFALLFKLKNRWAKIQNTYSTNPPIQQQTKTFIPHLKHSKKAEKQNLPNTTQQTSTQKAKTKQDNKTKREKDCSLIKQRHTSTVVSLASWSPVVQIAS
jgi:hypothetical protein